CAAPSAISTSCWPAAKPEADIHLHTLSLTGAGPSGVGLDSESGPSHFFQGQSTTFTLDAEMCGDHAYDAAIARSGEHTRLERRSTNCPSRGRVSGLRDTHVLHRTLH